MQQKEKLKVSFSVEPVTSDIPVGTKVECKCSAELSQQTLDCNFQVCPHCGFHHPLIVDQRIALLVDFGTFQETDATLRSTDFLNFGNDESYAQKLVETRRKTGLTSSRLRHWKDWRTRNLHCGDGFPVYSKHRIRRR